MSRRRHVVAFTIPSQGHVSRMLPLIAGLCEMGVSVDFFAHETARALVERTGARFIDIYAGRDMDVPDGESLPALIRNVSFAGYWGDAVTQQVAASEPSLIIHDTFAVIARVVAFHLQLPRVNMRAGHNQEPVRVRQGLQALDWLHVSEACHASVQRLQQQHGMADASPFSYFIDHDADLNICSEPPEFLPPDQRAPFEPLEFFGSYWPGGCLPHPGPSAFGPQAENCLRVYVAFGTAAWFVCPDETMRVLEVLADALAALPQVRALISLGTPDANVSRTMEAFPNLPGPFDPRTRQVGRDAVAHLQRHNVRVAPYVNQDAVLREASLFVTHHGLNSTHEAIANGVPMVSYPLFDDQPGMAARCQALGLAVALKTGPGHIPSIDDVHRVLSRIQAESASLERALAQARDWELAVMEKRPAVLQRIVGLMG